MGFMDEFLYDFAVSMPRVMVTGNLAIIDNIKSVELISGEQIVVRIGKTYTAVKGRSLLIKEISDERMIVEGAIEEVQFYGADN